MAFRTKLDYSDNRQIKQRERTFTELSGGTTFGVPFSALTSGADVITSEITEDYYSVTSTFSGNSATTVFNWYDSRMELLAGQVTALTPSNSATTQELTLEFAPATTTTIDDNVVNLTYTGTQFDLAVTGMTDLGGGAYSGTVEHLVVEFYTAGTLDFTGRTIWIDNPEITRTHKLIVTNNPTPGHVLTCVDSEGMTEWVPNFSGSGATTLWSAGTGTDAIAGINHGSTASGDNAVAYGFETLASGDYSHAEGTQTSATTFNAHAEGNSTLASGPESHAEGDGSTASGNNSHAEGQNTTASGINSHTEGWDTTANGHTSHAEGYNTTASGNFSHAQGNNTSATTQNTHAEGSATLASGAQAHAEGASTTASGQDSHAEGTLTVASGTTSHAQGRETIAGGDYSHAQGHSTTASGNYSHSEGSGTTASGIASHAEGNNTQATGDYSHAEGDATSATTFGSHAEGFRTLSSGDESHAEGHGCIASGHAAHAEGSQTTASGDWSHAQGYGPMALGEVSHAGGNAFDSSLVTPFTGYSNTIVASGVTSFVHYTQTSASGLIGAYGDYSVILGGTDHNIGTGATSSGVIGGADNIVQDDVLRSVVIGGSAITADTNDMVYVPDLVIDGLTSVTDLQTDANGKIIDGASDVSLKENITNLDSPLNKVLNLRGVSFDWKKDANMGNGKYFGLIAQEVQEVIPEIVKQRVKGNGKLTLDYKALIPWLVEAVKELNSTTSIRNNTIIETQTINAEDNNITLNFNGTHDSALNGGIIVNKGVDEETNSEFIINSDGDWVTNNYIVPYGLTIPEYTPDSSDDDTGKIGEITRDDNFIYVKTNNGWLRTELKRF